MFRDDDEFETVSLEDLLDDARYDEAVELLAVIAAEDPSAAWARSLRAICLSQLHRDDEAITEAEAAVRMEPDSAFGHWALGTLLAERRQLAKAMLAARRAVAIDPDDSRHHALVAKIHAQGRDWKACRAAADAGLHLDPTDEVCNNLRTLSMRATDTTANWDEAVESLVHQYPASSWARTGKGWRQLETGHAAGARESFEQAIALDPTSEWAREGLIESIKAQNPIYAGLLRVFLWLDRMPSDKRWTYIIGGMVAYRVMRELTEAKPAIGALTYPFMAVWVLFVVASWTSYPLSDFVLSRLAIGRRLIRGERLLAAKLVAGTLGVAMTAGILALVTGSERAQNVALAFAFLVLPVAAVFKCSEGWPRKVMGAYAFVAGAAAIATLVGSIETSRVAMAGVLFMSILGTWIGAALASREPSIKKA